MSSLVSCLKWPIFYLFLFEFFIFIMYLILAGPNFFGKTRLSDSIVLLGTLRY
jgi:hypothetical protein